MTNIEKILQMPAVDADTEQMIDDQLDCDDIYYLISKNAKYHNVSIGQVLKIIIDAYKQECL